MDGYNYYNSYSISITVPVQIFPVPASVFLLVKSCHPASFWNYFPSHFEIDSIATVPFLFLYRWMVRQVLAGCPLRDEVQDYIVILNRVSKQRAVRTTRKMMQKVVELGIIGGMVNLLAPFHQRHNFWRNYRWEWISGQNVISGNFHGTGSWKIICDWTRRKMWEHSLYDLEQSVCDYKRRQYFNHSRCYGTAPACRLPWMGRRATRASAGSIWWPCKEPVW